MTVVYLDRVAVLNLLVDYLLLLATATLAGTPLRRLRFGVCAALGALYAVLVFICRSLANRESRMQEPSISMTEQLKRAI